MGCKAQSAPEGSVEGDGRGPVVGPLARFPGPQEGAVQWHHTWSDIPLPNGVLAYSVGIAQAWAV